MTMMKSIKKKNIKNNAEGKPKMTYITEVKYY